MCRGHFLFTFQPFYFKVSNNFVGYICLTSVTRVKCGVRSTLCWKIGNISGSTELFGLKFVDSNLKLPNLLIHILVMLQK